MILPVLQWPDDRLKRVAVHVRPEQTPNSGIRTLWRLPKDERDLIADMIDTMRAERGCGLAAPQVGIPIRLFIMELRPGNVQVCINPDTYECSNKSTSWEESCLSVDGPRMVTRPKWVKAHWIDADWRQHTARLSHMEARCFQHELDHLNGVTIASPY